MGACLGERSVSESCPHCGRPSQPGARFCRGCGKPLAGQSIEGPQGPGRCQSCGAEPAPHALFCHRCGQSLASETPTSIITADEAPSTLGPLVEHPVALAPQDASIWTPVSPPTTESIRVAADKVRTPAAEPAPSGALVEPVDGATGQASASDAAQTASPEDATTIAPRPPGVTFERQDRPARSPNPPATDRRCSVCGAAVALSARFCRSCGGALAADVQQALSPAVTCSRCGEEVESWARFCRYCGAAHAPSSPPARLSADQAGAVCVVCGAPAGRPGGMCAGCAEAVPGQSSQRDRPDPRRS
jgi:hypothetical protein